MLARSRSPVKAHEAEPPWPGSRQIFWSDRGVVAERTGMAISRIRRARMVSAMDALRMLPSWLIENEIGPVIRNTWLGSTEPNVTAMS